MTPSLCKKTISLKRLHSLLYMITIQPAEQPYSFTYYATVPKNCQAVFLFPAIKTSAPGGILFQNKH